jgi:hypothetical protein
LVLGSEVPGPEEGEIDDSEHRPAALHEAQGRAAQGDAVHEVRRAVNRIERPHEIGVGALAPFFLAEEADARCGVL